MKKLILTIILTLSATFNVFAQEVLETEVVEINEIVIDNIKNICLEEIAYTNSNVVLRQEPNTESYKLSVIKKGTEIKVLGNTVENWTKIQVGELSGFTKTEFLSKTKPETTYQAIFDSMTQEDELLLAQLLYHEARGDEFSGQCAVIEIVLNRVNMKFNKKDNVHDVIYDKRQFTPAKKLKGTKPLQTQYDVINYVKENGATMLPTDYKYFSTRKVNGKNFIRIGLHFFSN